MNYETGLDVVAALITAFAIAFVVSQVVSLFWSVPFVQSVLSGLAIALAGLVVFALLAFTVWVFVDTSRQPSSRLHRR